MAPPKMWVFFLVSFHNHETSFLKNADTQKCHENADEPKLDQQTKGSVVLSYLFIIVRMLFRAGATKWVVALLFKTIHAGIFP